MEHYCRLNSSSWGIRTSSLLFDPEERLFFNPTEKRGGKEKKTLCYRGENEDDPMVSSSQDGEKD